MTVYDVICRMPTDELVTIEDGKKGGILIDCATVDRILAFDNTDSKIHNIVRNGNVCGIEIGKVYKDLIIIITI